MIYDTLGSRVVADITAKVGSIEAILKSKQGYLRKLNEQILLLCAMEDIEEEI